MKNLKACFKFVRRIPRKVQFKNIFKKIKKRRKNYTASFKIKVIEEARNANQLQKETAKKYKITSRLLRDWKSKGVLFFIR
jgi:hypothetical protein